MSHDMKLKGLMMPDFYVYILIGVIILFVVLPLRKLQAAFLLQKKDYYVVIREFRVVEPNERGKGKKIESRYEHCFDSYHAAGAFFDLHEKLAAKPSYEDRQQINYFYVIPAYSASDAISKMNKPLAHTGSFHHEAQYLAETPSSTLVELKRHWDWTRRDEEPKPTPNAFDRQRERVHSIKDSSTEILKAIRWNTGRIYSSNAVESFTEDERLVLKELYLRLFADRGASDKNMEWSNMLFCLTQKQISLEIEAMEEQLILNWAQQKKLIKINFHIDSAIYNAEIKMKNRKLKKKLKKMKKRLNQLNFRDFVALDQSDDEGN